MNDLAVVRMEISNYESFGIGMLSWKQIAVVIINIYIYV